MPGLLYREAVNARHRSSAAPIAPVQFKKGGNTLTLSYTLAFTSTSGNTLFVAAAAYNLFDSTTPISDGVNTFTKINGTTQHGLWYANNVIGNANGITIKGASAAVQAIAVGALELSGVNPATPINVYHKAGPVASNAPNSGDTTAGVLGNYVLGVIVWAANAALYTLSGQTFTPALSSQTDQEQDESASRWASVAMSYGPIAAANTEAFSGGLTGSPSAGWYDWCVLVQQ
jgi:hypothetical protein